MVNNDKLIRIVKDEDNDIDYDEEEKRQQELKESVEWYVNMAKGLWTGLVKGVYNINDADISDRCLDKETVERTVRILNSFNVENLFAKF